MSKLSSFIWTYSKINTVDVLKANYKICKANISRRRNESETAKLSLSYFISTKCTHGLSCHTFHNGECMQENVFLRCLCFGSEYFD